MSVGLVRLHIAIRLGDPSGLYAFLSRLQAKRGGYLVEATVFCEEMPDPNVLRLLRLEGWEWTTQELTTERVTQVKAHRYLILDGTEDREWTVSKLMPSALTKEEFELRGIPKASEVVVPDPEPVPVPLPIPVPVPVPRPPPPRIVPAPDDGRLRIHVSIPSYRRPAFLMLLLEDLVRESRGLEVSVHVYDDASPEDYSTIKAFLQQRGWGYTRFPRNHGKLRFWELNNLIFRDNRHRRADYFFRLQDDVRLCKGFFQEAVDLWESIDDPRKISLNLLKDTSRANTACWTGVMPTVHGRVDHTGWVDGLYMVERRFFEVLHWRVKPISPRRWRHNRKLSSGVGAQLSQRLHRYHWGLYRVQNSLISHGDAPSVMNPEVRARDDMAPLGFQGGESLRVVASLATIPERKQPLRRVVAALLPQVSRLNVYLNNYSSVPTFLNHPKITVARSQEHGDRGDAGKFFWADHVQEYHVTCDDDLAYPADYVLKIVQAIDHHHKRAVVGFHGARLRFPLVSYYKSRQVFHFMRELPRDEYVHVLGTGTVGYHASTIRVSRKDFRAPNMADVWLAVLGQKQTVPFLCLSRRHGWLKDISGTNKGSIYESSRVAQGGARDTGDLQTRIIKQHLPWSLHRVSVDGPLRKASFLVPTTSRPHLLEGCLESLVNQTYPMGWDVNVMVAGGLSDPGRRVAERMGVRYVECKENSVGAKLNTLLGLTEAELIMLADDDDLQAPNRAEAAIQSFEAGTDWSSSSVIRYLDLATGRVARWTGNAQLVGTCVSVETGLAKKAGGWPTVPRGKDGLFKSRIRTAKSKASFQDLGPQIGMWTVCIQHARNIWRRRPFPPTGRTVTRGRFSVLGEGLYQELDLPPSIKEILGRKVR